VDFPRIIRRLKELNYRGAVTIEREISGPQQMEDVREAKVYLEKLIG
jgi:sugar phosphate isomerase/epimerase